MFIESLKIRKDMKISELVDLFEKTAFNAKRLSIAAKIYEEMIKDNAFVFFTLAGAMIPAGMRNVISDMIKNDFIHCLVTTGANVVHEICESLGFKHISGVPEVDDVELSKKGISRIYDVFIEQKAFEGLEEFISGILKELNGTFGSYEFLQEVGKRINDKNSFLRVSYERGIPIFCPTLHDSIIGLHITIYSNIVIDYKRDISKLLDLCFQKKKFGIVIIGGGVPKNFTLQSMLLAEGFDYAIQITTDLPEWGGLSGATLDEAKSWCKLKPNAKYMTVYCDATIALPLIYAYLLDKLK